MHDITIMQVIIAGLILIKHNMQLMSGHITNISPFLAVDGDVTIKKWRRELGLCDARLHILQVTPFYLI